jgi:hypothetical protein
MFWKPDGTVVDHCFVQQAIVTQKLLKPKQKTSCGLPQHLFFFMYGFSSPSFLGKFVFELHSLLEEIDNKN